MTDHLAAMREEFTVFAVLDALTRLACRMANAGDRTETDHQASALLALASPSPKAAAGERPWESRSNAWTMARRLRRMRATREDGLVRHHNDCEPGD